ncbi:acyltransferase family protein [Streptomyces vinaceus]|uniref:acyltransferase family protein n=1 Tax=Streptomyces vinaceus TaxID=1960 RepID=UPI0037F8ABEA
MAKGICIVLVVLWHVTVKDYLPLGWLPAVPVTGFWGAAGQALLPLRMPLFFVVSGMFTARAVSRPWPDVARARIIRPYYLYLLWVLVHTALFQLTPGFDTVVAHSPGQLLEQLTFTPTNQWYLLALPAYFVLAKLTRFRAGAMLAASLVLSVAVSSHWFHAPGNRAGLLQNLFWFLVGLHGSGLLGRFARHTTGRRTAAYAAGYLVLVAAAAAVGADNWPGVRQLSGLVGICVGISGSVLISRTRVLPQWGDAERPGRTGRALARLGRHTLPIYVIHMPLVAFQHEAAEALARQAPGLLHNTVLSACYPLVATSLAITVSLLLYTTLRWAGARWLFELPCGPARLPARSRG